MQLYLFIRNARAGAVESLLTAESEQAFWDRLLCDARAELADEGVPLAPDDQPTIVLPDAWMTAFDHPGVCLSELMSNVDWYLYHHRLGRRASAYAYAKGDPEAEAEPKQFWLARLGLGLLPLWVAADAPRMLEAPLPEQASAPEPPQTVEPDETRLPPAARANLPPTASLRAQAGWQNVYVFISSTFNDMHAERDYLVKRVFPELSQWCAERRLRLMDIDLRWGITEEDSRDNLKTVEICLRNIDRCRPFSFASWGNATAGCRATTISRPAPLRAIQS